MLAIDPTAIIGIAMATSWCVVLAVAIIACVNNQLLTTMFDKQFAVYFVVLASLFFVAVLVCSPWIPPDGLFRDTLDFVKHSPVWSPVEFGHADSPVQGHIAWLIVVGYRLMFMILSLALMTVTSTVFRLVGASRLRVSSNS